MKIPMPDEAKLALEQTQNDMAAMRQELTEIKSLLRELVSATYLVHGIDTDSPPVVE